MAEEDLSFSEPPPDIQQTALPPDFQLAALRAAEASSRVVLSQKIVGLVTEGKARVDDKGNVIAVDGERDVGDWYKKSILKLVREGDEGYQALQAHFESLIRTQAEQNFATGKDTPSLLADFERHVEVTGQYRERYERQAVFLQSLPLAQREAANRLPFPDSWGIDTDRDNEISREEADHFLSAVKQQMVDPVAGKGKLDLNGNGYMDLGDLDLVQQRLDGHAKARFAPVLDGVDLRHLQTEIEGIKEQWKAVMAAPLPPEEPPVPGAEGGKQKAASKGSPMMP